MLTVVSQQDFPMQSGPSLSDGTPSSSHWLPAHMSRLGGLSTVASPHRTRAQKARNTSISRRV